MKTICRDGIEGRTGGGGGGFSGLGISRRIATG